MAHPIRDISFTFERIRQYLSYTGPWIYISIVLLLADIVNSNDFTVAVTAAPSKSKPGQDIRFTCTYSLTPNNTRLLYWVDGDGAALYTDTAGNVVIGNIYKGKVSEDGIMKSAGNQTFTLKEASACESSTFKCSVWDSEDTEKTASVRVDIEDIKPPNVQFMANGETKNSGFIAEESNTYEVGCSVEEATLGHELKFMVKVNKTLIINKTMQSSEDKAKCVHSSDIKADLPVTVGDTVEATCTVTYSNGVVLTTEKPAEATTVATTTVTSTVTPSISNPAIGKTGHGNGGLCSEPLCYGPIIGVCCLLGVIIVIVVAAVIIKKRNNSRPREPPAARI